MGSISARIAIEQASVLLVDAGNVQWTLKELLGWLNAGQLAIVLLRPDAKTRTRSAQLVPGTKQTITHPDLRVLDVVRNMGPSGTTPGRAILWIDRDALDSEDPNWHTASTNVVVRSWTYDQRVPGVWWCFPPQPPTGMDQVDIITSAVPTDCELKDVDGATADTNIDIDDIYLNPLVQFVVYRAFSKDNEYTQPGGKASLAQQEFFTMLGVKTETDKRFRPEKSSPPAWAPPRAGNQGAFGET